MIFNYHFVGGSLNLCEDREETLLRIQHSLKPSHSALFDYYGELSVALLFPVEFVGSTFLCVTVMKVVY